MTLGYHNGRGHRHGDSPAALTDGHDPADTNASVPAIDSSPPASLLADPAIDHTLSASTVGAPIVSGAVRAPPPFNGVNYVADVYGSFAASGHAHRKRSADHCGTFR
jgi:hypothetical protein